jgi:hypothetical protein
MIRMGLLVSTFSGMVVELGWERKGQFVHDNLILDHIEPKGDCERRSWR